MNLWIRSQDKQLLKKVETLRLEEKTIGLFKDIYICIKEQDGNTWYIGSYKTKERALEVLDEIQDLLKSKALIKTVDNNPPIGDLVYNLKEQIEIISLSNNFVYEMPKE